jgi:RHS repeat-associated protein
MMKSKRFALLVFVVLLGRVIPLVAAQAAGSDDPAPGRYVVTLANGTGAEAVAAMKHDLATVYRARIESSADVRQFTVTMLPARAKLLSADPQIIEVVETPLQASSARHLTTRTSGYGDNGQSGTYTYDGSGNITAIGTDTFLYDAEGRLVRAMIRGVQEDYTYDAFGNRKTATGATNCLGQTTCATPVTVDSNTNHLTNSGLAYDSAGNMTSANGGVYTYDGTGMMTEATVGSDDRQFVYTADDERIAIRQGASWTWTVRDQSAKVLREFTSMETNPGSPSTMTNRQWAKDYVWRDGLLLATNSPVAGIYHYHLDHLGTPRLITDANHIKIAEHTYYPFGAEIALTPHESTEEAMKFTGHERDIVAGDGHFLDYMHARDYSPTLGRFLNADPVLGDSRTAQTWNRYSYVRNDPTDRMDPDGRAAALMVFSSNAFDDAWISFSVGALASATPAPTLPNGDPAPPPAPPPPGASGTPNDWVFTPNANPAPGQRPGRWKPREPVPSRTGAQPSASWDPQHGHWDVDIPAPNGGKGDRQRFLPDGTRLGPDHRPVPNQSTSIMPLRPLHWILNAEVAVFSWWVVKVVTFWSECGCKQ